MHVQLEKTLQQHPHTPLWVGGANLPSGAFALTLMARRSEGTRVARAPIKVRLDKITRVTGPPKLTHSLAQLFPPSSCLSLHALRRF